MAVHIASVHPHGTMRVAGSWDQGLVRRPRGEHALSAAICHVGGPAGADVPSLGRVQCLRRRIGRSGLVTGAAGGDSSPVTLGLSRER